MTGWAYHINSLVVSCYRRQHKLRRAISTVYSDQVFYFFKENLIKLIIYYFYFLRGDQVNCKQQRSQIFEQWDKIYMTVNHINFFNEK